MALKLGKCRLCLKLGDFYSIFTVDNSLQLAEMVMECARVKVYEGDGLPDKICTECVQKLSGAFIFKQQCERSDQELRRNYVPPPGFSIAPSPNRQSSDSAFSSQTEMSNQAKQAEAKTTPATRRKRSRDSISNSSVASRQEYRPSPKNQRVEQIKKHDSRKSQRYESDTDYEEGGESLVSLDTDSDEPLLGDHGCDQCQRAFKSRRSLALHKRTHSEKRLGSDAVVDIPKTLEDAHDDDQKLACDKCGKTFKLKIMLKRHYDTCEKSPSKLPQKELQVSLEPINPEKKYSCEMCPTKFKTVDNLEKHMRVCHAAVLKNKDLEPKVEKAKKPPPQPIKVTVPCIYCGTDFDDYYVHTAHFLECPKKTKAVSFECPLCQKVTYKQSSYFVHIKNVHFEPRCGSTQESPKTENFQCRMCNKKLPNQEQLIQHLAAHVSNIDDSTADDDLEAAGSQPGLLQCRQCDKTFTYKKALLTHEMKHTEDEVKDEPPDPAAAVSSTFNEDDSDDDSQDDGDNTCDICEKMFSYKRLLINHKKTKHNMSSGTKRANVTVKSCDVKCQICDAEMKVGDSLDHNRYHIARNEKPKNLYTCTAPGCGDTFKSCTTLSTHIKMVHRLKKQMSKKVSVPDLADFCEVVVTKSEPLDAVQSHSGLAAVPANSKQVDLSGFTCPICTKKMPTLISLKRHVNWHSNVGNLLEKTLECFVCKETFRFKGHYRLHMRTHYSDTNLDPKFLTCGICGRRSKHLRAAQAHMNFHKQTRFQNKDYKCAICHKVFQVRKVYLTHMAVHFKRGESGQNTIVGSGGPALGPHGCHLCGKDCLSEDSLKHHLIWHKSKTLLYGSLHQCNMCDLKFTNKLHLKLHIRTHYEDDAGPFKCPTCGKGYTDEDYFKRHVKSHNFDSQSHAKRIAKLRENKVKCPICERYYSDLPKLIRHLRRTHPQSKMIKEDPDAPPRRVLACKLCAKVFHDERRFRFHQESHLRRPTHFVCRFCFKTCLSQKLFNLHVRAHLYKKHTDNPWPCAHCNEKFVRALELQRHLKSAHDITETWEATKDTPRPDAPLQEFQCSICYKVLASKGNYERHIDYHNTLRCNYCFEYFSGSQFLEGHLAFSCDKRKLIGETETVPRKIKCDICYKAFHVQVKLDCHMRTKHGISVSKTRVEATQDITCDYCFRVFENEDALASHKIYHRSVGYFGCIYCERKFSTMTLFKKHKNAHFAQLNAENPFKCEHCDETFVPFRDMIYHMRDVHNDDKEWLIMPKEVIEEKCHICNKTFYNLQRHLGYHKDNRCKKCLEYFFSRVEADQHLCAVESGAEDAPDAPAAARPEECDFCFKQFTRAGSKKAHRNLHRTSGSISCRFCCLKFKTMDAFNIHAFSHRSKKYKKKPLKCRTCGEKFIQYGPFMKHMRDVHGSKQKMHYRTVVKAEQCVVCHAEYPNLHNHYRAHLQNYCAKCGKYFTSSRVFSYHECDKEDIDPSKVFTSDADLINIIKNYRPKDEKDDEKFYDITEDEDEAENGVNNVDGGSVTQVTILDEDSQDEEPSMLMPLSIQSPIISDVLSLYQEKKPEDIIDLIDEDSVGFEEVTHDTVTIDDD